MEDSLCPDFYPRCTKPIQQGCAILKNPPVQCNSKRKVFRHLPPIAGVYQCFTHRNCTHAEYLAIRERVIGAVPEPSRSGMQRLEAEARRFARTLPYIEPLSYTQFVQSYTGRKKTRYQNAVDSLLIKPLRLPGEAIISSFVKSEKFDPFSKKYPAPRMIQARNGRFNVEVGRFLKPMEHQLYRIRSKYGLPVLGKGLNNVQRGELLAEKISHYDKPLVLSIDASRFDQHVSLPLLKLEHNVYRAMNSDPWFLELLKCQEKNVCFTQGGWLYRTCGKRMSGDMNTASGNCLLMYLMTTVAMQYCGVTDYELFVDGDDTLIICHEDQERKLAGMVPAFLEFGQEIKLENRATCIEDVVWCQAKPVKTESGWCMVANWRKVLSSMACGTKYWDESGTRYDMGYSVGQCLYSLYPGVPIIAEFARSLCKRGKINRDIFESDMMYKIGNDRNLIGTLGYQEIPIEVRNSFSLAFGLCPSKQLEIEGLLRDWSISDGLVYTRQQIREGWEIDPDFECGLYGRGEGNA